MLHRRLKAAIICAFLSLSDSGAFAEGVTERLTIGLPQLIEINADGARPHEAVPLGVPRGYDWASRPRVGAGNDPGPFAAATGWGQVFWVDGAAASASLVQVRNFQVLLCHGPQREWSLLQRGDIEGRQFGADFRNNANQPAALFSRQAGVATIAFAPGSSFHFWPRQARASLPDKDLCGVLVLLQARAASASVDSGAAPGTYLIGLGADYWVDLTAGWDSYKTNKDIAIGRLKLLGPAWAWYGLSTAADADLQRLHQGGYQVRISTNPP